MNTIVTDEKQLADIVRTAVAAEFERMRARNEVVTTEERTQEPLVTDNGYIIGARRAALFLKSKGYPVTCYTLHTNTRSIPDAERFGKYTRFRADSLLEWAEKASRPLERRSLAAAQLAKSASNQG